MNTVILGGGIAGILAAYTLRDLKPKLLEASGKLGGNFTAGGLKYLHGTYAMEQLLLELKIPFDHHVPEGRIHTGDAIHPHPQWLRQAPAELARGIQYEHWMKTRGTYVGFNDTCMNDPLGEHHVALRCDHGLLLQRLIEECKLAGVEMFLGVGVVQVDRDGRDRNGVHGKQGADYQVTWNYDQLITTLPLGVMHKLSPWANLPDAHTTQLGILDVDDSKRAGNPPWDYMYTPRAPRITRITSTTDGFQLEFPLNSIDSRNYLGSEAIHELLVDEASSMISDAALTSVGAIRTIPGHLQPLSFAPIFPGNWLPLGRFAEWDARATADKVLAKAQAYKDSLQ